VRGADERDEIRSRIDIVDLVGQSVLLKKAGQSWKGLCPFHADKNPSFTVDRKFGTYRCWSCGEHGDIFTWVMKTRHVEFVEALQILAEMAGVSLSSRGPTVSKSDKARWASAMADALAFFREQLGKSESARSYCERRGLSQEVLDTWEIGYAPDVGDALAGYLKKKGHSLAECKELFLVDEDHSGSYYDKFRGRLIFPIRNEAGDLVAFGGRLLGDGHPKYINSSDTPLYRKSKVLYGMNRAKDALAAEKRAVLTEGYLDVIACHSAGVKGALASLGTSLAEDHARLLRRWTDMVVILYDSDAAGQKAADRAVQILQAEGLKTRVALMPDGEDPDTLLRTAGPAAVQQAVESGLRPLDYKIQKIKATQDPADEEFWKQAVEALTTATNEMEEDRYIVELAALYPGATDQVSAQKALRNQVRRYKRQVRSAREDEPVARPLNPFASAKLHASEIAIFRALLEPGLRQLSWNVCGEADLFATDLGSRLATAVRGAFPAGPPTEKPSVWVSRIEPEDVRDTFMVAQYDPRVERITDKFLEDAIEHLRRNRQKRQLQQSKRELTGDDRLRDVYRKLKERQESDNVDAS
jgi:DNA primase